METNKLIAVKYNNIEYRYRLDDDRNRYIIGNQVQSDIYINVPEFTPVVIATDGEKLKIGTDKTLLPGETTEVNGLDIDYFDDHDDYIDIYIKAETMVNFGALENSKIILSDSQADTAFVFIQVDDQWILRLIGVPDAPVYVNGIATAGIQTMEFGDVVTYRHYTVNFFGDYLRFYHQFSFKNNGAVLYTMEARSGISQYPYYSRSPRIFYLEPDDTVKIPPVPSPVPKDNNGLISTIAPSLAMVGVTVATGFLMGRGILVFATAGMSAVTVIISASKYFKDRKERKRKEIERGEYYEHTLNDTRKDIRRLLLKQREMLLLSYPDLQKEEQLLYSFYSKLWERNVTHMDFLNVRIGIGSKPLSFKVEFNVQNSLESSSDPLTQNARELANKYDTIYEVPIVLDIKSGVTGIAGRRELVLDHLQAIIIHMALAHSYKDVRMVFIYDEEKGNRLDVFKWLPHTWTDNNHFKTMIKNARTRDNILTSIYQILKQREMDLAENKDAVFTSIVFVVADIELISDHVIMEFLDHNKRAIGVYTIFLNDVPEALPESTTNIVTIRDNGKGYIIKNDCQDCNTEYQPDLASQVDLEKMSRFLAPIQHVSSVVNAIPKAVTLFELYGVNETQEFGALHRWDNSNPHKTLAVPIGLRGINDIVYLNLHEKAHGPHGLLAGTTGSGKSETIQTYIISLALNFHPYDVGFLLIDYKGGGMANIFEKLPHLLGTITNLDGAGTMRALVAIKSELLHRQEMFSKYGVNHIDAYQRLFKEGKADEPIPHLFIISDEFAELKSERPEFIKELVSAARIGRSLGVHLILATQKPNGVVDDQIWSNSKFKICLKVQDAADSQEMLKTPDAASITLPGRGYLQVGNNEVYELFQSAYSGAECNMEQYKEQELDYNIYEFNDLGQFDLITNDFSRMDDQVNVKKISQLDATIDYLHNEFDQLGLSQVKKPWLPPLEERIDLGELMDNPDLEPRWEDKDDLCVTIGMLDKPQKQAQTPFNIDFFTDGNVAVFGSARMGKSTALKTIALSGAVSYTPDQLQYYIMDFGNNNILSLKNLPHSADAMTVDDVEKINKFQRMMLAELKSRKDKFGQESVGSLAMYRKATGDNLPAIVIIIDNFDVVREQMEELEQVLTTVSRDGQALGIYVVLAASKPGVVRYNMLANIKTQLALYMIDKSETYNIVGRTELESQELAGRGLVHLDDVYCFQIALPMDCADELEEIDGFNQAVDLLSYSWTGELPRAIPMLPEQLDIYDLKEMISSYDTEVPFALDYEFVQPFAIDFSSVTHLLIVGGFERGKSNAVKVIVDMLDDGDMDCEAFLIDNSYAKLSCLKNHAVVKGYYNDRESMEKLLSELKQEVDGRLHEYLNYMNDQSAAMTSKEFYTQFKKKIVFINGIQEFVGKVSVQDEFVEMLNKARLMGIHFIFCDNATEYVKGYDSVSKAVKSIDEGIMLVDADQQQVWNLGYNASKEKKLSIGEAYYIKGNSYERIMIPEYISEGLK